MSIGFFAILKNISILADDTSIIATKVAIQNTAGILGDDLAVNAEKASGFSPNRELPVLYAITKGSFINKIIIVPLMMVISAFFPFLIVPTLILGGIYLSFEGFSKLWEYIIPNKINHHKDDIKLLNDLKNDPVTIEKDKIKSAIFTDFILSIEIVLIALGSVSEHPVALQAAIVSIVALLATIGVYGIVALIVRMDDVGYWFIGKGNSEWIDSFIGKILTYIGVGFIISMSYIIKSLGFIGMVAMFFVAGGIFVHKIEYLHHITLELNFYPFVAELSSSIIIGAISFFLIDLLIYFFNKSKKLS